MIKNIIIKFIEKGGKKKKKIVPKNNLKEITLKNRIDEHIRVNGLV
jgi:hypothetical protein